MRKSNAAVAQVSSKVISFDEFKHEDFASQEIKTPRLARNLSDIIKQVKPVFDEWMIAEGLFERNTLEVAKMVGKAWDVYKLSPDTDGKRVGFARLFDPTILPSAKTRDLGDNAVYNKINYLLYKVVPVGQSTTTSETVRETAAQRAEARLIALKQDWLEFLKFYNTHDEIDIKDIQAFALKLLGRFLPPKQLDEIVTLT